MAFRQYREVIFILYEIFEKVFQRPGHFTVSGRDI